jgi:hypothetical protein
MQRRVRDKQFISYLKAEFTSSLIMALCSRLMFKALTLEKLKF